MAFTRRRFPQAPAKPVLYPRNRREAEAPGRVLSTFKVLHRDRITVYVLDNVTITNETDKAIRYLVQGAHLPWTQQVWIPKRYIDRSRFPPDDPNHRGRVEVLAYFFAQIGKDQDIAIKRVLGGNENDFNLEEASNSSPALPDSLDDLLGSLILPAARFPPVAVVPAIPGAQPPNPTVGQVWVNPQGFSWVWSGPQGWRPSGRLND